ncbi:DUF317 domain-containing protein [Streptomyces ziwulingensis]|uniref:DUF317 domain-containing protein n=1 Tax=Streptomyces ziwulingensis TaxID=1045501 RepID=A0ABP9AIA8_9ACTN
MTSFAPSDRVLVSPRHLAGGGADRLGSALGPLITLFGWHHTHDPHTGHTALTSPCESLFVDFDPCDPRGVWWRIIHHEPYWQARFTRQTPIEAIAAVTQVLPQSLGDRRHAERIPLTTSSLAQTARLTDWAETRDGQSTTFTSADGHCTLTHQPDDHLRWHIRHSLFDGFDTDWSAAFTRAAPARLVAQFFAHLTADTPVERTYGDLPYLAQRSSDALITPVHGAAVNPHVHHALARAVHPQGRPR